MNKDTSAFSLQSALEIIKPHFDYLSFRRRDDYLEESFEDVVNGLKCSFRNYSTGTTSLPGNLLPSDRMFSIPVRRDVRCFKEKISEVSYHRLLLERCDIGGTFGYWYFQTTSYVPAHEFTQDKFYALSGRIFPRLTSDKDVEKIVRPPTDFPERFWECIRSWIVESARVREKALESLRKGEQAVIGEILRFHHGKSSLIE